MIEHTIREGAMVLFFVSLATVSAMFDDAPALNLDVREYDGIIEVELIGEASRAQKVSYTLEVSGQSSSRHRGSTTLTPGTRRVLSAIRVGTSKQWCVQLTAEEEGREPYKITKGACPTI